MEIYDVFISYRRSDGQAIAESLYKYLSGKGLRVFYDNEKLEIGEMFPEQLRNGIKVAPMYVLVATKDVFNFRTKEDWVREEMECALEEFKQSPDDRKLIVLEVNGAFPNKEELPEKVADISDAHRIILNIPESEVISDNQEILKIYQSIFEKATVINRRNLWNAAHRWLEESKKEGGRFANLNICETILPNVEQSQNEIEIPIKVENGNKPLFEAIQDTEGHMYLIGQGGIGKTTALVHIMNEVYGEDKSFEKNQQIPIYVDLSFAPDTDGELYRTEVGSFIRRSIYRQIRTDIKVKQVSSAKVDELDELFTMPSDVAVVPITEAFMQKGPVPEYLLLLDGLNEVSTVEIEGKPVTWRVAEEIQYLMNECPNVRVVLTSRSDETMISGDEIKRLYLAGVENDTIVIYLKGKEFTQERINKIMEDKDLAETLRIPLFLTMYASLSKDNDAVMQGEILREFFNERRNNLNLYTMTDRFEKINENVAGAASERQSKRITAEMYSFMLDFVLPEIAWYMEKNELFYLSWRDIKKIVEPLLSNKDDIDICGEFGIDVFDRYRKEGNASIHVAKVAGDIKRILGNGDVSDFRSITQKILTCATLVLGVLQESNSKYGFVHQHIRDYFAAIKNINIMKLSTYMHEEGEKELALECMNQAFYTEPVSFVVRKFMGESLDEHKNQPYCNDMGQVCYGVPDEVSNRTLVDRTLNIYRGYFNGEVGYALYSLLKVLSEVRKSLVGCNLSELDMERCQLNSIELGRYGIAANVKGSKINFDDFFFRGQRSKTKMEYSPDGEYLLLYGEYNDIYLLNAKTGIYVSEISKNAEIVKFVDNKMIVAVYKMYHEEQNNMQNDGYIISLWDLSTYTEIKEIHLKELSTPFVSLNDEKDILLVNDKKNQLYIISIPDLQIQYTRISEENGRYSDTWWFFSEKKNEIIAVYYLDISSQFVKNKFEYLREYAIEYLNWKTEENEIQSIKLEDQIIVIADNRTDIVLGYRFNNRILLKKIDKICRNIVAIGDIDMTNPSATAGLLTKYSSLCSFSNSGKWFAVNVAGNVYLYETNNYMQLKMFRDNYSEMQDIAFNEEMNTIALCKESGEIEVYDLNTFRLELRMEGTESSFKEFKLSYDATMLLTQSAAGRLHIWDLNQRCLLNEMMISNEMKAEFSMDGKFIFVYSKEKITVYSVPELKEVFSFDGHNFILNQNGDYISIESGGDTYIFNIPEFNQIQKIPNVSNKMFLDNKCLVEHVYRNCSSLEYIYLVADIEFGDFICELYRDIEAIEAMSASEKYIALGNSNGEIYLFDANNYQLIKQYHSSFDDGFVLRRLEFEKTGKYLLEVRESGIKSDFIIIQSKAIIRNVKDMTIVYEGENELGDTCVSFQNTTFSIKENKNFYVKDLNTFEILFEHYDLIEIEQIVYQMDYDKKIIACLDFLERGIWVYSFDDVKNKRHTLLSLDDGSNFIKPRWLIEDINQLNVIGVDLRNLHPDTKLSPEHEEILRSYGALVS